MKKNIEKYYKPSERLEFIVNTAKINFSQLAKEAGFERINIIYDIKNGRTKDISADVAEKITKRYPNFDIGWLMSGYGNPLVDTKYYTQKDRVETLMREENLNTEEFANRVGAPVEEVQKILDGKEEGMSIPFAEGLTEAFPYCDSSWLLLGIHPSGIDSLEEHPEKTKKLSLGKATEKIEPDQSVILYDIHAAANLRTLFNNKDQHILGKISIPDMPKCDGAIYVTIDSMYPILKSGDIVIYKEIVELESLIYGEMYLVSFNMNGDEYLTVKYINRSDIPGHIKLVSYNQHYAPMDVPLSAVRAIAIVKMSIRKNTMI